jgi:hypothetical protein
METDTATPLTDLFMQIFRKYKLQQNDDKTKKQGDK